MESDSRIGRYQIKREFGRGGMATVYLAHDPYFERDVAVKVMPHALLHEPTFRTRFAREAKTIAALEHKAIVPVYDYGEHEGQPYLVMRAMQGGSLAEHIEQQPLSLKKTAVIINRIAGALDKAHAVGIVHRDLKPANILFDEDGDAYLSDFGIAKMIEQTSTLTGTGIIGTPQYMSPEQAKGSKTIDKRSDIYALGVIVYEMLTGKQPFSADTPIGVAVKHITEPIPNILQAKPDLPLGCETIIQRTMAKQPEQRYESASELAAAVTAVTAVSPTPVDSAADLTAVDANLSLVATNPTQTAVQTAIPVTAKRQFPVWGWVLIPLLLIGLAWGGTRLVNSNTTTLSPTETSIVARGDVDNHESIAPVAVTNTPTWQPTETSTPRTTATQTATAEPTNTPTAQATATVEPTATQTAVADPQLLINVSSVNIRSGPGTAYAIITTLPQDAVVTVLASNRQRSWYNIELTDGRQGWVAQSVTEPIDNAALAAVEVAATIPAPPPTAVPTATSTVSPTAVHSSSDSSGSSGDNNPPPENTPVPPP